MAGVLSGHLRQTLARLREHAVIRVVHDTTTFRFVGDRDGLGAIRGGAKGFLGHIALVGRPHRGKRNRLPSTRLASERCLALECSKS